MIKIEVRLKDSDALTVCDQIAKWCISNIGPSIPRGKHNQKRKKLWAIKKPAYGRSVNLMIRLPTDATLASLRWGS
jgi:hypothetical protein